MVTHIRMINSLSHAITLHRMHSLADFFSIVLCDHCFSTVVYGSDLSESDRMMV